jgi:Rrf2 family protein
MVMLKTQKKEQYALRAMYELAKHRGKGPKKISEIAAAQSIPLRFLEVILSQLKGSGLVKSKRGFYGGYFLVKPPDQISVGQILRFLEKHSNTIPSGSDIPKTVYSFTADDAFARICSKVRKAMYQIYDETSLQDLINIKNERN